MENSPHRILFHGTSEQNANQIFVDQQIRHKLLHRVFDEKHMFPTTNSYVYLTDSFNFSVYCANRAATLDEIKIHKNIIIFECSVPESELEIDWDEVQFTQFGSKHITSPVTYQDSLKMFRSVRIARSISLQSDVIRYTILPTTTNKEHPLVEITRKCVYSRSASSIPEGIVWYPI